MFQLSLRGRDFEAPSVILSDCQVLWLAQVGPAWASANRALSRVVACSIAVTLNGAGCKSRLVDKWLHADEHRGVSPSGPQSARGDTRREAPGLAFTLPGHATFDERRLEGLLRAPVAPAAFAPTLEPLLESAESLDTAPFQPPAPAPKALPKLKGTYGRTDGDAIETLSERCEHLYPSVDTHGQPIQHHQSTSNNLALGPILRLCEKLWSVLRPTQQKQTLRADALKIMRCTLLSEARIALTSLDSIIEAALDSQFHSGGTLWQLHANHLRAQTSQRFTDDVLLSVATRLRSERLAGAGRFWPVRAHDGPPLGVPSTSRPASGHASESASPFPLSRTPKILFGAKVDAPSIFPSSAGRGAEREWDSQPLVAGQVNCPFASDAPDSSAVCNKDSHCHSAVSQPASSTVMSSAVLGGEPASDARRKLCDSQDRGSDTAADKSLLGGEFRPPSRADPLELMQSAVAEFGGVHAHVLDEAGIQNPNINPTLFVSLCPSFTFPETLTSYQTSG